jgi:alpha-beta hydrolase superfamily lysophospholipase
MGSFMVQHYLILHGPALAGAVLSGSSGGSALQLRLADWIARLERRRLGPEGASAPLSRLLFGRFNRAFAPNRTDFDWLSRDPAQVDLYVADPRCGFMLRVGSLLAMNQGLRFSADAANLARIPAELPLYVFSGELDPVHRKGRGLRALLRGYRRAGLHRVSERIYPGGRHEMFNETNRDEVIADLVAWLEKNVA